MAVFESCSAINLLARTKHTMAHCEGCSRTLHRRKCTEKNSFMRAFQHKLVDMSCADDKRTEKSEIVLEGETKCHGQILVLSCRLKILLFFTMKFLYFQHINCCTNLHETASSLSRHNCCSNGRRERKTVLHSHFNENEHVTAADWHVTLMNVAALNALFALLLAIVFFSRFYFSLSTLGNVYFFTKQEKLHTSEHVHTTDPMCRMRKCIHSDLLLANELFHI